MKKNILVILVVIGVVGVVLYLLKDRLKALLGERVKGEEIPGEIERKKGITLPGLDWLAGPGGLGLKRFVRPEITMGVYKTPVESPARWLREEIAPVLKPLYPARYVAITKGLMAYLIMGETALPPDVERKEFMHPPANGPYSWALPQF